MPNCCLGSLKFGTLTNAGQELELACMRPATSFSVRNCDLYIQAGHQHCLASVQGPDSPLMQFTSEPHLVNRTLLEGRTMTTTNSQNVRVYVGSISRPCMFASQTQNPPCPFPFPPPSHPRSSPYTPHPCIIKNNLPKKTKTKPNQHPLQPNNKKHEPPKPIRPKHMEQHQPHHYPTNQSVLPHGKKKDQPAHSAPYT